MSSESDKDTSSLNRFNKFRDPEPDLFAEGSAGLRRGRRPRTKPRAFDDYLETTPHKNVREQTVDDKGSDTEDDVEKCRLKTTSLLASDDVDGESIFKFKSRHSKLDLQNKVNSTVNSPRAACPTPSTPKMNRLSTNKALSEATPMHVKEIMKKRIINTIESEHSDSDFSASSSDFQPDKSEDESSTSAESEECDAETAARPLIRGHRNETRNKPRRDHEFIVAPDNYFMMHGSKKMTTSDHTLERLKNYNPTDAQLPDIDTLSAEHKARITALNKSHEHMFDRWLYVLSENYSVLLYGVGSKRNVLKRFQAVKLKEFPCVIVNGFFPSLTMKSVLDGICIDLLGWTHAPSNASEAAALIERELGERGMEVFLIIHNIDGEMLRNNKAQNILADLSRISNIHTIASIDHINAPLMWDHSKLSRFSFTWWDVTTLAPYSEETSYENSLTSQRGGALQLSSLRSVHRSLTSNARSVFRVILEHQLQNRMLVNYQGLSFRDLYCKSRDLFLVSSDIALRAQLTEFLDHKLVRMKRTVDGECLTIPIDNGLLQQFLDQIDC